MSRQVTLSDTLFKRIQAHSEPLVDTIESTIARIIDEYEASKASSDNSGVRIFDPISPPNLGHTTVMRAIMEGVTLRPAETYWNNIFVAAIKHMAAAGTSAKTIYDCIPSNKFLGEKTDNGYKFIKEAGVSIQGLDANNAWRSTYLLCASVGIGLEVTFRWQNKEGVEMPSEVGRFIIKKVAKVLISTES